MLTSSEFKNVEKVVVEGAFILARKLRSNLRALDKNASGQTIKSIRVKRRLLFGFASSSVVANQSLNFIDKGRRKGAKQPPPEVIDKWIIDRGIQGRDRRGRFIKRSSLSFLIGRAIARDGIEPTNIIANTLSQVNREIESKINQAARQDVQSTITNVLRN